MPDRFDVAVIGAGVVGLAAARALARAGRRVLLLDRGPPAGEASGASAGMLAAQIEARAGDPLLPLAVAARERHAAFAAECDAAGHSIGLFFDGITVVALDDERARELEAQAASQRTLGLDARWLARAELLRRQPGVAAEARGAFFAPDDGRVNNVALGVALAADCQQHGVAFAVEEVVALATHGGRVTGVRSELAHHRADAAVLAGGAWSPLIAGLPRAVPVAPVRGQMALTAWPTGEPQAVLFGRAGYIVPRQDAALLGSTMERAGFEKRTTDAGLAHIRREAAAILPALAAAPFTRTWSGLRPMSSDGLPILGRDPELEGLVYATGHGRNGILLGPITGEIVRDLLVRGETSWDIRPYRIERFRR